MTHIPRLRGIARARTRAMEEPDDERTRFTARPPMRDGDRIGLSSRRHLVDPPPGGSLAMDATAVPA